MLHVPDMFFGFRGVLIAAIAIACFSSAQINDAVIYAEDSRRGTREDGLVLHYSFDDDAGGKVYDESGHENHGKTVGKVGYEQSFRGRAARFTSNRTYILSAAEGLNMHGWRQATVSVWIKTNRITTYGRIISRGEVTGDQASGISMQAGSSISKASFGMMRQFKTNPPIQEGLYTSSLMAKHFERVGRWVHMVGMFDGQFMRLYINGKLDRQAEASGVGLKLWDRESHRLVIGNSSLKSRMAWSDKYFDGLIDEAKIWNRALSVEEIAALYERDARAIAALHPVAAHDKAGRTGLNAEQLRKGLELYYSFDDDAKGNVYDESGNELHGQAVGDVQYQPSFRGRAVQFSSNKTYILCDNLRMNQWRSLTVSAWIKTNRITAHAQVFSCGQVTGDETSGFTMQVGGTSKAAWVVKTEYQGRSRMGQAVYTSSLLGSRMKRVGKWVHVTGVFDGTFVKFYINGKLDCQNEVANAAPAIWNPDSHKLVIGNTAVKSRMAWLDKYFDGLVDEVKVWSRGLSAEEIAALYQRDEKQVAASLDKPGVHHKQRDGNKGHAFWDLREHRPLKGLVAHWTFDGPQRYTN